MIVCNEHMVMTSFPGTMEEVRDFFEAVTRNLNSAPSNPRPANERPKKNKRRPSVLPTMFLKKKKTEKHAKEQSWDKDVICLPKDYIKDPSEIPIPRGLYIL